jgi:hypothetical protein
MDPLILSASVAGLVSLALEVSKMIGAYVDDVHSATGDSRDLYAELTALHQVLEKLVAFLRGDGARSGLSFKNTSVLSSAISVCEEKIKELYKKFDKWQDAQDSKMTRLKEKLRWPLQKEDCEKSIRFLRRFTQTFQFSLTIDNWYSYILSHTYITYPTNTDCLVPYSRKPLLKFYWVWTRTIRKFKTP